MYTSVQLHIASKYTMLPSYQMRQIPVHAKYLDLTKKLSDTQAFKRALLFPSFLICSYFSLLFHENALLSQLFNSEMSFMRKNPEIFPRSLLSLRFYK